MVAGLCFVNYIVKGLKVSNGWDNTIGVMGDRCKMHFCTLPSLPAQGGRVGECGGGGWGGEWGGRGGGGLVGCPHHTALPLLPTLLSFVHLVRGPCCPCTLVYPKMPALKANTQICLNVFFQFVCLSKLYTFIFSRVQYASTSTDLTTLTYCLQLFSYNYLLNWNYC